MSEPNKLNKLLENLIEDFDYMTQAYKDDCRAKVEAFVAAEVVRELDEVKGWAATAGDASTCQMVAHRIELIKNEGKL